MIKKLKSIFFTYIKRTRKKWYSIKIKKSCAVYGINLSVNGHSICNKRTYLGDNVNFNGMHILGGGKVKIGSNFHSGSECMMLTRVHNYDNGSKIPYDDTYVYKEINIEDNVWIGSRVILLGGITIGEGAIIQAGSVVVSNIPKHAIAGGHPAKVYNYRNIDHYEKLKKEQKFH